jgi:hypothetical protein
VRADDPDAPTVADDLEATILARSRNLVAFIDGTPAVWRAVVLRAASIAVATNGRITLVTGVRQRSSWCCGAPVVAPPVSAADLAKEMEKLLREASALVPTDVPVVMVAGFGSPKHVLRRVLADGRTDLVLVSRGLARTQRARRRLASLAPVEVVGLDARWLYPAVPTPCCRPRLPRMHVRMARHLGKLARGDAGVQASVGATEDREASGHL